MWAPGGGFPRDEQQQRWASRSANRTPPVPDGRARELRRASAARLERDRPDINDRVVRAIRRYCTELAAAPGRAGEGSRPCGDLERRVDA